MIRNLFATVVALLAINAQAMDINQLVYTTHDMVMSEAEALALNWKVGDTTNYSLNMGFIKGSMTMTVKSIDGSTAILGQDVDLSFFGKQSCEATIDTSTGETKRIVCNGHEHQAPGRDDVELVEMKDETITVPAGTFQCVYIKALQKSQNAEIEQWVNIKQVPISGMVKSVMPGQMGKVTLELVSFKKN